MENSAFDLVSVDLCSHCGACLSYCEWDAYERMHPGQRGDASLCRACMLCFRICPRAQRLGAEAQQRLLGGVAENQLLGYFREACAARAQQKAAGAQDAGVTTALVRLLLEERIVDAALLTARDARWSPVPFVASTVEEVERAAGSKYTATPALATLREGTENFQRLAFVGTPCQVAALRNLQSRQDERYRADRVVLAIGLFCAESFTYDGLVDLIDHEIKLALSAVTRFDIKKNNLIAFQGDQRAEKPLVELKHIVWPICHSCTDFTAELADLSIGAVGSKLDENTILVRSARGVEVMDLARRAGVLELGPVRNFGIVERIAQSKRVRRESLSPEEAQFLLKRTIRGNRKKAGKREM